MNLRSKTLLLLSIVMLIGAVFGVSAAIAFADDPFKNKVSIEIDEDNKVLATKVIMEITTP